MFNQYAVNSDLLGGLNTNVIYPTQNIVGLTQPTCGAAWLGQPGTVYAGQPGTAETLGTTGYVAVTPWGRNVTTVNPTMGTAFINQTPAVQWIPSGPGNWVGTPLQAMIGSNPGVAVTPHVHAMSQGIFQGLANCQGYTAVNGSSSYSPTTSLAYEVIDNDHEFIIESQILNSTTDTVDLTLVGNELRVRLVTGKASNQAQIQKRGFFAIALPGWINPAKIQASFNKGLLTIHLPKVDEIASNVKKIKVA